ncbi:MAG: SdrD B-like domain-containing protein [Spirosomataceae bacterium]
MSFSVFLLSTVCFLSGNAQTIKGTVYRDFNANGTKNNSTAFNEIGVKNVLVCAYKSDGTLADSTRTAADGTYTLSNAPTTDTLRVEFKDFTAGDYEGPFDPTGSRTSVQFVAGGSTGVNLGINYPADYCDTQSPQMVTTCFVAINAADNPPLGSRDALVGAPYDVIETSKVISHYATVNDIGAAWGLAYKRETAQIFSAAFTKRHVGFAEQGPGAIFVTSGLNGTPTTAEFFNFGATAGTDMHTDVPIALNGSGRLDSYDIPAYDAVGKVGLGDMDISDDGKTLWVTNLFNRKLYSLNIATKDTIGYAIPNPCDGKSYRPFATKYYRGKVYVGVVCTREDATVKTDTAGLAATVYAFDGSTFTSVLNFPLTYFKQATNADLTGIARAERWRPWIPLPYFDPDRSGGIVSYPEAWLTDIEFDVDGSMIVGLRDRFGDQMGYQNRRPIANDNSLVSAISPGEVLRAGPCGPNGTWLIEQNGSVCGSTASANQIGANGPGGGKYYWGDRVQDGGNHGLSSQAGLGILPGSGKLAMTAIDPTDEFNTGGFKRLINSNGNKDGNVTGTSPNPGAGAKLYAADAFGYGKANGLGDLEVLCNPQPIEIGNRIWKDTDKDGIQDANEIGIDGVTVTLCDSTGASIVTVVTGNGGQYYFSSASTPGSVPYVKTQIALKPNTKYILKIGDYATQAALLACDPTAANTTADNTDSDFEKEGNDLKFTLTTGGAGQNDFKADGGFIPKSGSIGDFVWKDVNDNGIQDLPSEKGVPGVIVQLLNSTDNAVLATDTTDANGLYGFTGLASGSYKVKIVLSSLPDTCQISPKQDVNTGGGNDTNDSDFNPATGESQVVVIDVTKTGIDKDNPTIDAALFVPCVQPAAGTDLTLCAGSSTTVDLKDAATNEVWSKGAQPVGTNAIIDASTGVVSGLSSVGDYFFILTYKGQALCSDTVKVTVNAKPNAGTDITGANAICNLIATVDLPDAANGETWAQLGNIPKAVTINASTGVVTGMDAIGTYQFVLSNATTGCADTVAVEVKNCAKGSLGDFVWKDVNDNGIQDLPSEKGVPGVILQLLNSTDNAVLATDTTDANGLYEFTGLDSGTYKVKIVLSSLPDTCQISSKQDVNTGGGTDANDSDFNPTTGESQVVTINTLGTGLAKDNPTIDAALVRPCIKPTWQVTTPAACSPTAAVYSVSFSITNKNGVLKVNAGTLSGNNPYTVTNIPNNTNLVITDSLRANCIYDTTITAPDCSCPVLNLLTPSAVVCKGDTLPTLRVSITGTNTNGVGVAWYADASGGAVLSTNLNFKPSGTIAATDTFYVQLTGLPANCTAQGGRKAIIITVRDCSVDLALKKLINKKIAHIGDTLTYTLKVWNESNFGATGVEVTDSIATTVGFIANSFTASRGSAAISGNVIKWTIGAVAANGDTVTLTYKVKATQEGVHFNVAEISKTDQEDTDSTPGNGDEEEDDIDRQCFTVPFKLCPGEKVQVNVPAKYTNVLWFKDGGTTSVGSGNEILFAEAGTYTFTATDNICPAAGCCPIIIEPGDNCCPEDLCVPFTIKQTKKGGK